MNSVNLITNFDNEIDDDDLNAHYNSAKVESKLLIGP